MKNNGLIHIYTGEGKGKTSASIGLCMRAYGSGMTVLFSQFLKGQATSELITLEKLGITVVRTQEVLKFVPFMSESEKNECKKSHDMCYNKVKALTLSGQYDLVVLDEVIPAVKLGLIALEELVSLIESKPQHTELVLTGRDAPNELIELANYVSVIKSVKHPFEKGIISRKGIEY